MIRTRFKVAAEWTVIGIWVAAIVGGLWYSMGSAFLLLAGSIAFVFLVWIVILRIKRRRFFRAKGYEISHEILKTGERRFVYRERFGNGVRELRLPAELIEYGHPVYYRLPQETWADTVPDWAHERRLEIENLILEDPFYRP